MHLFEASNQWANRPADERFASLQEMHDVCADYYRSAAESDVNLAGLTVRPDESGADLVLESESGQPARFTHWSFGQLARRVQVPADYLGRLPAPLAAECITTGLRKIGSDGASSKALFHNNGSLIVRAFTSDRYTRIWNWEVTQRLLDLQSSGWRVPPARPAQSGQPGARPATDADCMQLGSEDGLSIRPGDMIAPAGLYASAHDMFAFLVNENVRIEDGSDGGLGRGVFVSNSEVGAASFKLSRFCYRFVCGNHIVWHASNVQEIRIRHVGSADSAFSREMVAEIRKYADESADEDRARVVACQRYRLADDKDAVLDLLFGKKILPRRTLALAYDHTVEHEPTTDPRTAWGMMQGISSISQASDFADRRATIDAAAGRVAQFAF